MVLCLALPYLCRPSLFIQVSASHLETNLLCEANYLPYLLLLLLLLHYKISSRVAGTVSYKQWNPFKDWTCRVGEQQLPFRGGEQSDGASHGGC